MKRNAIDYSQTFREAWKKPSEESHSRKLAGLREETPNTQEGRAVRAVSHRMGPSASEPGEAQVQDPRAGGSGGQLRAA